MSRNIFCLSVWVLAFFLLTGCSNPEERRDAYYQKAVTHFEGERYSLAEVEIRNALRIDPDFAKAQLLLGRVYFVQKNWRSSYAALNSAVDLDPDLLEAHLYLGRIYHMAGESEQAEEKARMVLERDPGNADAGIIMATVMIRQGKFEAGRLILEEIIAAHPDREEPYILLSRVLAGQNLAGNAVDVLSAGLEVLPDNRTLMLAMAGVFESVQDYCGAEEEYRRIVAHDPGNGDMHLMLVHFFQRTGQVDEAMKELQSLMLARPDDNRSYLGLGAMYMEESRFQDAVQVLEQGRAYLGGDYDLSFALAETYLVMGDVPAARAMLHEEIKRDPEHLRALDAGKYLAGIYYDQGDLEKAAHQLDMVLRRNPDDVHARTMQGRIFLARGEPAMAVQTLRRAYREERDDPEIPLLLARAHFQNNEPLMAVEYLRGVSRSSPGYARARKELAEHHLGQGDHLRALQEIDRVLSADPGNMPARIQRGDVLAMKGDASLAAEEYSLLLQDEEWAGTGHYKLGVLEASRGNFALAHSHLEKALARSPLNQQVLQARVMVDLSQNRVEEAGTYVQELRAEHPGEAFLALLHGDVYLAGQDPVMAREMFALAASMEPEWMVPWTRKATLDAEAKNWKPGIAALEKALLLEPESIQVGFMLGTFYEQAGQKDMAEKQYAAILERDPGFWPAANNLAFMYASSSEEQKLQKALELASKAAKSNHPQALDTLGWTHYRLGNLDMALEKLDLARQGDPQNLDIAYHLAVVLAEIGDRVGALGVLEQAMSSPGADGVSARMLELRQELDM